MEKQILALLKSQFKVAVQMEWLSECLSFLMEEEAYRGSSIDPMELARAAFQQLLFSDLKQPGILQPESSPSSNNNNNSSNSAPWLLVQIKSVLDISVSKYNQFRELKEIGKNERAIEIQGDGEDEDEQPAAATQAVASNENNASTGNQQQQQGAGKFNQSYSSKLRCLKMVLEDQRGREFKVFEVEPIKDIPAYPPIGFKCRLLLPNLAKGLYPIDNGNCIGLGGDIPISIDDSVDPDTAVANADDACYTGPEQGRKYALNRIVKELGIPPEKNK